MISNPIFFYTTSVILFVFTLITLFARNVVYSLLASVVVFFCGALFFYLLGSEYNAIIQAAIYGLAVPVIVGVSIMFTTQRRSILKHFVTSYVTILCSGIFILAFIYLTMMSLALIPDTFNLVELIQTNTYDNIRSFSNGIYVNYVWAFELVSLLLTIVLAGFGLLKKRGIHIWK